MNDATRLIPSPFRNRSFVTGLLTAILVALMLSAAGSAKAADPPLSMAPSSFDFGAKNVGGEAVEQAEFVVTNNGATPVTFGLASTTPSSPFIFRIIWDLCAFQTLQPAQSCTVIVVFEPTEAGDFTGEFRINSDAEGPAPTAPLEGTGYPRLLPGVKLDPDPLDFGILGIGQEPVTRTVTLTDTGLGDLDVRPAIITGPNAGDFAIVKDRCRDRVLASGMTCDIDVSFSPFTAGDRSATLFVPTNSEGDSSVSLNGSGRGIVPGPPPPATGTATVKVGAKLPKAKRRILLLPITCAVTGMDHCEGRITALAGGRALGWKTGGSYRVAGGEFNTGPGRRSVRLKLEPRAVRALRKLGRFKAIFTVVTEQESGTTTTRSVKRVVRR